MPQGTFDIKCNIIGVEPIHIPMDDDLLQMVAASNNQMLIPLLFAQVLRNLKLVEERLNQLEAISSGPERFTALSNIGSLTAKNGDSSDPQRGNPKA